MKRPRWVSVDDDPITFNGGLDVVTPPLQIPRGFVRRAQNFEQAINGGYKRGMGYERWSGQAKPSDAAYAVLAITLSGSVSVGAILQDNATTSFGTVLAISATQAVLTLITGTFSTGNIKVLGVVVGTCTGAQVIDGAGTSLLHAQYKNLAADVYRALIAAVPGSGNVLGVWLYNDVVYAFRNNAGGTATDMYKSTASGWSLVALGEQVAFSNANTSVGEGDTLTQGGVTATITRVVVRTGSLASGVNTGILTFATHAGGNFAAGAATSTGAGALTLSGAQTAITFAVPTGRFEFVNHNFGGAANTKRMYGCDGKNLGFEFDGTVLVPIATGMPTDTPTHVAAHKNQLFFSFGGSVQHSGPTTPYVWSAITGTAELAMGDTVTGFQVQPGDAARAAMTIFTRNNTAVLYGSGVSTWDLVFFDEQAGAYEYTIQNIFDTVMLDDRGITTFATSMNFGNFDSATISKQIATYLKGKRLLSIASLISRDTNQYRLFFSDASAIYVTFDNGKIVGMMPQLFPDIVRCCCSGEMSDGSEAAFFGSSDGFVYQMERGTSYDGDAIEAYLYLVFNPKGSVRQLKTYRDTLLEVAGEGYAEFQGSYELGYGTTALEQPGSETISMELSAVFWDSFTWDAFVWDGITLMPACMQIPGHAENISLVIRSNADYYQSFTLSGAINHYTPRRQMRAARVH